MPRLTLTERQRDVLLAIYQHHATHGYAPTIRELCEATGIRSTSALHYQLGKLEMLGYIVREYFMARTIRIVDGAPLPQSVRRRLQPPVERELPMRPPASYHGPRGSRGVK